jgi:hypothetical protein
VDPGGESPPTEEVVYLHEWALKLAQTAEVSVEVGELQGPLTIEFWLKALPGSGVQELLISGEGNEETFHLQVERQEDGRLAVEFAVPPTRSEPVRYTLPADAVGKWLHVAGVYDPAGSRTLQLYLSGTQVGRSPAAAVADMSTASYRIINTVKGETAGLLLDEVRLVNTPKYADDFGPERVLEVVADTRSLLHMEKFDDGALLDAAAGNKKLEMTAPEFVEIKAEMAAPEVYHVVLAPIAFPPELVAPLQKKLGQPAVDKLMAEWEKMTRAQRIAFLTRVGYPVKNLLSGGGEPAPAPAPAP